MCGKRRRNHQTRHLPVEFPQQFSVQRVTAVAFLAGHDDFRTDFILPHQRCRPRVRFFTSRTPAFVTGLPVERCNPGLFAVVVDHKHLAIMHYGRSSGPIIPSRFLWLNRLRPQRLSVHVVAIDSQVSEQHVNAFAISSRCFSGVSALGVPRHLWLTGMSLVLPEFFAGVYIKAVHHPVMNTLCRISHTCAQVQALARREVFLVADDCAQIDAVTPDDRTGPAPAGHVDGPLDVFSVRPRYRQTGVIRGNSVSVRPSKPVPVIFGDRRTGRG